MCDFIAQLVEHRTGIAEITGLNPIEALVFSGFFFNFQLLKINWKLTAMIILHFDLQPQLKYMNYFMHTSRHKHFYKTLHEFRMLTTCCH